MTKQVAGFFGWIALCFCAAAIGGFASVHAGSFYAQLIRPDWAPPGWLFAPVWTVLYVLMGVSAWLVWSKRGWRAAGFALSLFCTQLGMNALWTWLFFYFHLGAVSFFEIMLLWWLILATAGQFWRIRPLAGALLIPYLLWVTYAAKLNLTMWQLNERLLF